MKNDLLKRHTPKSLQRAGASVVGAPVWVHTKGSCDSIATLQRVLSVLSRVLRDCSLRRRFSAGFLEGVLELVFEGGSALRSVLRRGS